MVTADLKRVETHFDFGRNWREFSAKVTADHIATAADCLRRLLPGPELQNASFFDVGCGSGLSMLAAKQLGAATVTGVDIDADSVGTAEALLARHLPDGGWSVRRKSVFDLTPEADGLHDVVHSWGVLHHTGDMWGAIDRASRLVKPKGYFVLALYRKTPFCPLWAVEKRLYTAAPPAVRFLLRLPYKALYLAGLLVRGRNPLTYIARYTSNRGMDWHHDVDDWLGGYPYQSVSPTELAAALDRLGFSLVRTFERPPVFFGIFGSHCDEFVAVRR